MGETGVERDAGRVSFVSSHTRPPCFFFPAPPAPLVFSSPQGKTGFGGVAAPLPSPFLSTLTHVPSAARAASAAALSAAYWVAASASAAASVRLAAASSLTRCSSARRCSCRPGGLSEGGRCVCALLTILQSPFVLVLCAGDRPGGAVGGVLCRALLVGGAGTPPKLTLGDVGLVVGALLVHGDGGRVVLDPRVAEVAVLHLGFAVELGHKGGGRWENNKWKGTTRRLRRGRRIIFFFMLLCPAPDAKGRHKEEGKARKKKQGKEAG